MDVQDKQDGSFFAQIDEKANGQACGFEFADHLRWREIAKTPILSILCIHVNSPAPVLELTQNKASPIIA